MVAARKSSTSAKALAGDCSAPHPGGQIFSRMLAERMPEMSLQVSQLTGAFIDDVSQTASGASLSTTS